MPVDIEVFEHTDQSRADSMSGKEPDYSKLPVDTVTFYNIDYVGEISSSGYGIISSGGVEFISPYNKDQINGFIKGNGSI